MNKYSKIFIFIIIGCLLFLWWYIGYKDIFVKNNLGSDVDYFVSNKSWNTNREKKVIFRKWDELEFFFVIKNKDNYMKEISFFLDNLLKQVKLNDVKIDKSSNYVSWGWAQIIKVIWIADNNWIVPDDFKIPIDIVDKKEMSSSSSSEISTDLLKDTNKQTKLKISFDKYNIVSDIDNIIKVYGSWVDTISKIWIWEKFFPIIKDKSWSSYINIPQGSFVSGEYFTFALFNNSKIVALEPILTVTFQNKKVVILNIFPPVIKNDISRWITVQWKWLKNTLWVQFSNNTVFEKTDFQLVSDSVIAVKIPNWLAAGNYSINVMTIDWIFEFKDNIIKIEK